MSNGALKVSSFGKKMKLEHFQYKILYFKPFLDTSTVIKIADNLILHDVNMLTNKTVFVLCVTSHPDRWRSKQFCRWPLSMRGLRIRQNTKNSSFSRQVKSTSTLHLFLARTCSTRKRNPAQKYVKSMCSL